MTANSIRIYGTMILTVVSSLYLVFSLLFTNTGESNTDLIIAFLPYVAIGLLVPIATAFVLVALGIYQSRTSLGIGMAIPLIIFSSLGLCLDLLCIYFIWVLHIEILAILSLVTFFLYKTFYTATNLYGLAYDAASLFVSLIILIIFALILQSVSVEDAGISIALFPVITIFTDLFFRKKRKSQETLFKTFIIKNY